MGLLDIVNETLENFDVENGNVNGSSRIPVGEYDVVLKGVAVPVYDSGWTCLFLEFEVTTGDFSGRVEQLRINLEEPENPKHKFILQRNIRLVAKLAHSLNLTLNEDDWEDENTLSVAFNSVKGNQCVLVITETENKKDPSNPYRNHDAIKYADDVAIEDDDLPF